MADMNRIHEFAVKWLTQFRNPKTDYIEFVDHDMADDCAALGFEMDCGHAFEQIYGKAANSAEELSKIIDDVTDIPLLGSAVYSQWRYFNHWAYDGAEILKTKNRSWFIVALERLASLTGNRKPDQINRIVLDYHRLVQIRPQVVPEGMMVEVINWNYTEQLIIDRETETLEHFQNIGTGCKISRKYEIEDGIKSLLDHFDADDLFGNIVGNPNDVMETPNEVKDYTITIDYKKNSQKIITGAFDENGLPDDFGEFADTVFDFIDFYGLGEIFNPSVYGKLKCRTTDYIFCSVVFKEGQKSYYYLAEDDSIEVDDFVVVPVGNRNHEAIVKVVNIERFSEGHAPLPTESIKHIIRKCTDAGFNLKTD